MTSNETVKLNSKAPTTKVVASSTAAAVASAASLLLMFAFKLPEPVAVAITTIGTTLATFLVGYLKSNKLKDVQIIGGGSNK